MFRFSKGINYILESDRASEKQTVFKIKTMTVAERMQVGHLSRKISELPAEQQFPIILEICKIAVQSVVSEDLPPKITVSEILDAIIDPQVITELVNVVLAHNYPPPDMEKNSAGPCSPTRPGAPVTPAPKVSTDKQRATKPKK